MKLIDILEFDINDYTSPPRPARGIKIKRPSVVNKGNDKIVYLGTDAIQRPHSGPQVTPPSSGIVPKIDRKKLRIRRAGRLGKTTRGETLWLDNPTATPCSSCGY